jgi:hypothetical protein
MAPEETRTTCLPSVHQSADGAYDRLDTIQTKLTVEPSYGARAHLYDNSPHCSKTIYLPDV